MMHVPLTSSCQQFSGSRESNSADANTQSMCFCRGDLWPLRLSLAHARGAPTCYRCARIPHYVLKINRRWHPLRHDCQYSDLRLFESCLKSDNWLAGTVPSHPLFSSCCFPQRRAWQTERQCYSSRRQQYELLAVKSCLTLNKSRESYIKLCVSFAMLLLWWNMQDPVWQNIRCEHVNSVTLCVRAWRDILRTFPGWLVWIKSLLSFVSVWWFWWVCVCVFVIVCVCVCWRAWLQISDALQQSYAKSALWRFLSLGYALMLCPFIIVLGGMFFLATALFFLDDREKAEKQ